MDEVLKVFVQCIGAVAIAVITYVVVPAIKNWKTTKLTESQQDQLTFWVTLGVRWAKQWMQTSTGQEKKAQVMSLVQEKVKELNLPFTNDDIDKAIEAIYGTVKDVTDVVTGTAQAEESK